MKVFAEPAYLEVELNFWLSLTEKLGYTPSEWCWCITDF